jgi:proton glutamate symport protein
VLFSGFLGIALIGIQEKEPLLSGLLVVEKVLARANKFAVRLTPIGLFAIAANTVGTLDTEQVSRLSIFLVGYGALSLLLTFWILPGLVTCLTPIPARRIIQSTRDALITAFMTGDLFVAILVDRSKELLEEHGLPEPEEGAPADIIIPIFYNFPLVAKLLSLSFVMFAAWYSNTVVSWARQYNLV